MSANTDLPLFFAKSPSLLPDYITFPPQSILQSLPSFEMRGSSSQRDCKNVVNLPNLLKEEDIPLSPSWD